MIGATPPIPRGDTSPPIKAVEDKREVLRWYEEGHTYEQIADMHEAKYGRRPSVSYLNDIRRRAGLRARSVHNPHLMPWSVSREHRSALDARNLRTEARLRADRAVNGYAMRLWKTWRRGLEESGMVVAYDPGRGFYRTLPRPGVDNDLVRVPDVFTTVRDNYGV